MPKSKAARKSPKKSPHFTTPKKKMVGSPRAVLWKSISREFIRLKANKSHTIPKKHSTLYKKMVAKYCSQSKKLPARSPKSKYHRKSPCKK